MMHVSDQPLRRRVSTSYEDAPLILPTGYWISQGIDEPTAYGIEHFQCQLVDRKFIYAHVIYIEPITRNVERIPHHEMLVSHWKRYMKNLVEHGRAKAFFIDKFQLHQSVLDVIVPSLHFMGQLAELGFCNCSLDRNGLLLVSKFLSQNHTLKRLLLNDNHIEDDKVAETLSLAVTKHPNLEELCISHCGVGNNVTVLPKILMGCNNLKILRLNGNNIGSDGITHIGHFLSSNPYLTSLRLDENLLSDNDAGHIAAALKSNSNLHYLHLNGNEFTSKGKNELITAVLDTTSLNSIVDSNHNCEIAFRSPIVTSHMNEKYWSTKRKIQSKVLLALYGIMDNTNNTTPAIIRYFNHVPLELIPHGLVLIQQELDCLVPHYVVDFSMKNQPRQLLGRMFDFVRVWNLPWLFGNGVAQGCGDVDDTVDWSTV